MNKRFLLIFLVVFSFLFFNTQAVRAVTADELRALIQQLQQQIAQLQTQLNTAQEGEAVWCYDFNDNLRIGDSGSNISALQLALKKQGFLTEIKNDGEFDEETASAIVEFQEKYKDDILTPVKLKRGNGFVGKLTRAKLNKLYNCGVSPFFPVTATTTEATTTPSVTITSPNGGEAWKTGEKKRIYWASSGVSSVKIYIENLYVSGSGSTNYITPNNAPISAGLGYYDWTIPALSQLPGGIATDTFNIRVDDANNTRVYDRSDHYFSITASGSEATTSTPVLVSRRNTSVSNIQTPYGSTNVVLGSFIISAGTSEGVDVNSFVFRGSGAGDATTTASSYSLGAAFTRLAFYQGNTFLTTVISPVPNTGDVSDTNYNLYLRSTSPLSLSAGQSVNIELRGDVRADAWWANGDRIALVGVWGKGQLSGQNVTDSNGAVGQTITLTATTTEATSTPFINLIYPKDGYTWFLEDQNFEFVWSSSNFGSSAIWIYLQNNNSQYIPVALSVPNTGSYILPKLIPVAGSAIGTFSPGSYKVVVCGQFQTTALYSVCSNTASITISSRATVQPSITVTSPNGGESWIAGNTYSFSWRSTNAPSGSWVGRIALYKGASFLMDLVPFLYKTPINSAIQWQIPGNSVIGNDFKIQAILYTGQAGHESVIAEDWSDNYFSIVGVSTTSSKADLAPTYITYPSSVKAGDSVFFDSGIENTGGTGTSVFNIKWFVDDAQTGYGSHSGVPASTTVMNGNSQYTWTAVEGIHTIKFVVDADNHIDESNETNNSRKATLTIASSTPTAPPLFTVTSPNGGEQWAQEEAHTITWTSTGNATTTRISLYRGGVPVSDPPSSFISPFIAVDVPNIGSYNWTIPSVFPAGTQYTVRIWNAFYSNNYDDSDNYFSIVASSSEATTTPSGTCTDSDGSNPDVYGNVSGRLSNGTPYTYFDECSGSSLQINERWCYESPSGSGNYVSGVMVYNCANGCANGACMSASATTSALDIMEDQLASIKQAIQWLFEQIKNR